jgi:molybdenum cofactor cytidylyltransferase
VARNQGSGAGNWNSDRGRLATCDYSSAVISAVVLAAGLSTRMGGQTKALLPLREGDTFVTRIIRTLNDAGIHDVVVVVGHESARVQMAVEQSGLSARTVLNPQYHQGQLSSVLAGLDAIDHPDVDAMILALVDAPLFSAATVRALVQRFAETGAPVVRAVHGDEHGHPVVIARSLFAALRTAPPTHGAKPVVRGNVSAAGDVAVDDPGAFIDIDTPDDYDRVLRGLAARAE